MLIIFILHYIQRIKQKINIKTNITSQSETKCRITDYAKAYAYGRPHTTTVLFHCRGPTDDRYTGTPSRIGDYAT